MAFYGFGNAEWSRASPTTGKHSTLWINIKNISQVVHGDKRESKLWEWGSMVLEAAETKPCTSAKCETEHPHLNFIFHLRLTARHCKKVSRRKINLKLFLEFWAINRKKYLATSKRFTMEISTFVAEVRSLKRYSF